ncbi:MAG: hypothetical protein ACRDFZ_04740 [Candidatus Limnocylindria bacterium]
MFQIEHPTDYLNRVEAERDRIDRRNRLLRALRGSTPPFSQTTEQELRRVMREQFHAQTQAGR